LRLLADENIPRTIVTNLQRAGHDVLHILDVAAGADDLRVEQLAARERRAILTFDKDFGDLALRRGVARSGVVLLRFTPADPAEAASLVSVAIATVGDVSGVSS
jgi:predicted nuclease of predicted toxin-antitoxin system